MSLNVKPINELKGSIYLPASKSYSIRAHFIGGCAAGSKIDNPSNCEDALIAKSLQVSLQNKSHAFDVGESGTSLRFLLPLLSFLGHEAVVEGKGTLVGRPNRHLCETLRQHGMDIRGTGPNESVPIVYKAGMLKPGIIEIDGSLSSQFVSALMIAAPKLNGNSQIKITGNDMVSYEYITMTQKILKRADIKVKESNRQLDIDGNQQFKPLNFHVPSDYGLAAFPMAAAALLKSNVTLKGNFDDKDLIQSDAHILHFLRSMGVVFEESKNNDAISIHNDRPVALRGGQTFSLKTCPDLVPIMSVLALFADDQITLKDIHHARAKESDRISDLREELLKIGADVEETVDTLTITPKVNPDDYMKNITLDPHHDHRLAMAFTVLGLRIGCRIKDISCTHKSYPDFVKDMKTLGMSTV